MPNTFPTAFPDWALSPAGQSTLNEQQTISFIGTPVSGSYQLTLGTATSPAIAYNANAATVQTAINDIYAAATATVTGGAAPTAFVADFGTNSQTNLIAQMTVSNNTMLTVGGAQVTVQVNISQASQLPALVNVDTAHQNNGWSLFEFPPFNLLNQWMALVGQAIRLMFAAAFINAQSSTKISAGNGTFLQMTGNSVTLSAGTWEVDGTLNYEYGTNVAASTLVVQAGFFAANGNDTNTTPAALTTLPQLTIKSGSPGFLGGGGTIQDSNYIASGNTPTFQRQTAPLVIALSAPATIYLVPNLTSSGSGSLEAITYIQAKQISQATS